jgi:hypothetical protein
MRRLKAFVVLVSVAGALTVLVPPAAAGPVSAVVYPPNPFITGPGEVSFEPGSILVVRDTGTEAKVLVNRTITPMYPPNPY